MMDKSEALNILEEELAQYRSLRYSDLLKKTGEPEYFERITATGEKYQIEVDFFIDDEERKTIRVLAAISYSFWTDFSPICSDFIIAPDGKFVGE